MQIFKFDPTTGERGDFIECTERAQWTASYIKPAELIGSMPTPRGFGSNAETGIHRDAGRGLIGEEISYIQPSQWICFCLGSFLIDNAEQWQWIILPPADARRVPPSLSKAISEGVTASPKGHEPGGSYRTGTARLTLDNARQLFGQPHGAGDGDKVTCEWFFKTPRGNATLRDYWWNGEAVLSIASNGGAAALWLSAWLRREHGIQAYRGMPERFPTS